MRPFEYLFIHSILHPILSPLPPYYLRDDARPISLAGYLRVHPLEQVQEFAILLRRADSHADAFVAVHFPSAEARYNSPISHLYPYIYHEPMGEREREQAICEIFRLIRFE